MICPILPDPLTRAYKKTLRSFKPKEDLGHPAEYKFELQNFEKVILSGRLGSHDVSIDAFPAPADLNQ